jgi:DNA processing protein
MLGALSKKELAVSKDLLSYLRLARTDRIGPVTFDKLIKQFGSAKNAIEALPEFSKAGGKKFNVVPEETIAKELDLNKKIGASIITKNCDDYPEQLRAIDGAPLTLTLRGNPQLLKEKQLGIVGARNASLNGRKLTTKIAEQMSREELVITSGMARGIDTAAHEGALTHGTIAVLAGGIDQIYPKENTKLYNQICEQGLVIAECAYGTAPSAHLFPRRNRIVSGLSQAILVVEATERSGSLITARLAGEQGRDVMAIPGYPSDPRAAGPNRLIREGAILVRGKDDILEVLNSFRSIPAPAVEEDMTPYESAENISFSSISETSETLINQLTTQAIGIDELLRSCHVSVSEGQSAILALEVAGRIQRLPGNRICRIEE